MSHMYTLTPHINWNNIFRQWKLPLYFSKSVLNHNIHFVDDCCLKDLQVRYNGYPSGEPAQSRS